MPEPESTTMTLHGLRGDCDPPGGFVKVTRYYDADQGGSGTSGETCRS